MNNFMCFITFQWICLLDRQFIHPRFIVMYLLLRIVIRSFQGQIRKKSSHIRTFYYALLLLLLLLLLLFVFLIASKQLSLFLSNAFSHEADMFTYYPSNCYVFFLEKSC